MIALTQFLIVAGILGCVAYLVAGRKIADPRPAKVTVTQVEEEFTLMLPIDCELSECLMGMHGPEAQASAVNQAIELAKFEAEMGDDWDDEPIPFQPTQRDERPGATS